MANMNDKVKGAAEAIINKKVEWLKARCERAMTLEAPVWINKTTCFVGTSLEGEGHYYKVSIQPGNESCGCKDWKYRGSANGIPCKHMVRAMAERMVKDKEIADAKEMAELKAEADQAVKDGELPAHAPEHEGAVA